MYCHVLYAFCMVSFTCSDVLCMCFVRALCVCFVCVVCAFVNIYMPYIFVGVFSCSFNLDRSRMFTDTTRITVLGQVILHGVCLPGCLLGRWVLCTLPGEAHHDATQALHLALNEGEIGLKNMLIKEGQSGSNWYISDSTLFYEQSHFLRVICQHASLPAVIEWRQGSKIMDKTSWINSVWQCEAVLYYCLLIVYVTSTSLFYRWFTFIPLSLWHLLNRAWINTSC